MNVCRYTEKKQLIKGHFYCQVGEYKYIIYLPSQPLIHSPEDFFLLFQQKSNFN
jgi:acetoacetate decarboxylase